MRANTGLFLHDYFLPIKFMKLTLLAPLCAAALLFPTSSHAQGTPSDIAARLVKAKAGQTVTLPAGTFAVGDLKVPDGVQLRGAGYDKTTLDAAKYSNGLIIKGKNVTVADLGIRNARVAGLKIEGGEAVRAARLKIAGNLTGVLVEGARGARLENLVVTSNRTGIALSNCADASVVNCTVAGNTALSLSAAHTARAAIFNDVFVNSPTAIYLSGANDGLQLDHNFYIASYIGKMEGEAPRAYVESWSDLSGYDAHSVSMPLQFADAEKENFRPATRLAWSPVRAVTSDWGATKFGKQSAPDKDIDGTSRVGAPDVGAYETHFAPPRPADGTFVITMTSGVKSAGLFTRDGFSVAPLFQNLPLAAGSYEYWLPARDFQGRAIAPGDYELRLVESDLKNRYLGLAGNFGRTPDPKDTASWGEAMFAFDAKGRIYIAQGWTENHLGLRAFDAAYQTPRWTVKGSETPVGLATDDRSLWAMHLLDKDGTLRLRRFDLESGAAIEFKPGQGALDFKKIFSSSGDSFRPVSTGLAVLNGVLYFPDKAQNKLYYTPASDPTFTASFDVPSPDCAVADAKNDLIWVISGGAKLLALDAKSGAVRAQSTPVPAPSRLSCNNGRLAVLSTQTGKIHLFDVSNPAHLKPLSTLGTGDGPYGAMRPDRFWFQNTDEKRDVALSPDGHLAVVDGVRISYWSPGGKLLKRGLGFWGQHLSYGRFAGDAGMRFWNIDGRWSMKLDGKTASWQPDTLWNLPKLNYNDRAPMGFFNRDGRNFGLFTVNTGTKEKRVLGIAVVEFTGSIGKARTLYSSNDKGLTVQHDANGDDTIDARDPASSVTRADGTVLPPIPGSRYYWATQQGGLIFTGAPTATSCAQIVPFSGYDAAGNPLYDWEHPRLLTSVDAQTGKAEIVSPYDFKTVERLNSWVMQVPPLSDGGYAASISLKTSGGTGLANGAGTDVVGYSKDGKLRWFYPFNYAPGMEGVQTIPEKKLVLSMYTNECNYYVMDEDGLGLGVLGMPRASHWGGMWSDHAQQQQAWLGDDGQPYYVLGDYVANGYHWFRIEGADDIRRSRVPVKIDAARATTLAALPLPERLPPPTPPTTKVLVRRLAKPLPIDGDLQKWRDAGITPQAIVTPESGSPDISGPADISGLIRLAYFGNDLYVQTLVFDNVVTFHQPLAKMYQQDGLEMGFNSFMTGFKYNVSRTTDHGATLFRNRFAVAKMDRLYTPQEAPRVIKVLGDAKDVEERKLIEAVYGVDLSKSKVIVTEFKLPLTPEVAFEGDPTVLPKVAPGAQFWIGFFLNDNDTPGADEQKYLAWPATYGTFAVKEAGALATLE
jgi:parallel beta-helix repeat protein